MAASEKRIVRELNFDLTTEDYVAKGKLAGQQRTRLLTIQNDLENAKKQAKLDCEAAEAELMLTLGTLASGKEARSVECIERKDYAAGKVEYWWQGVCMEERPLMPHENQQEMAGMKKTGMKKLALDLCKMEGGQREVDVAQAEDLLHKLCLKLARDPIGTMLPLVNRAVQIKNVAEIFPSYWPTSLLGPRPTKPGRLIKTSGPSTHGFGKKKRARR